ncbi:methanol dehydrogenase regulator [Bifidobacterium minimum]|uniref:Methanol dehydrogenase regulator n=1 Tax=Bifidobacterium minimum TaxID=1693 RepID=A0A087BN75_9BIFI|nr:MoxR family ATPase [Bifidobacterium minimum]KFI72475.1 methanol dehydrogenase regulator [Bifidobacterium minimum]
MPLPPPRPHMPLRAASAQSTDPDTPQRQTVSPDSVRYANALAERIRARFSTALVGQEALREALIVTMAAGGHILIESVPGLAKTTAARTLAASVSGSFKRIQCTPDLMPSDLVGTQIFDFASQRFVTQIGPIHANIVLLDEINRANAKTQSAMLEAMAEGATTIGGERIPLPSPFMVIATQNPIEEEGTFALPEAQMDRFMMKTVMTYPSPEDEKAMLSMLSERDNDSDIPSSSRTEPLSIEDITFIRATSRRIHVSDSIMSYAVNLAWTTRGGGPNPIKGLSNKVRLGASPRASIALIRTAQASALLSGRDYVIPEDVRRFTHDVMRHRLLLTFEALADGVTADQIIDQIIEAVPVP